MALRRIKVVGDNILHERAGQSLIANQKYLLSVIEDLKDTMRFFGKECAGLAANQIGETARVCLLRQGNEVMINPQITQKWKENKLSLESCYSIPGYEAIIPRAREINVLYSDLAGKTKFLHTDGGLAIVIQHEIDHLNGILISDYVNNSRDRSKGILVNSYNKHSTTAQAYMNLQLMFHDELIPRES